MTFKDYTAILTGASGLTQEQASICIYYLLAACHLDTFSIFPILALQGPAGTGKTAAMEQMASLVKGKVVDGRTEATIRDGLNSVPLAFIDEADSVLMLEDILTRRYSRETSGQTVNRITSFGHYRPDKLNLFGATVLCRRRPFRDVAMRSRAIVIRTIPKPGRYYVQKEYDLLPLAQKIKPHNDLETCNRVMDTWKPLLVMAKSLGDEEWLAFADKQIKRENRQLELNQSIEPSHAFVYALKIHSQNECERVKLSTLRDTLKQEFDLRLTISQLLDLAQGLELPVLRPHGYFQIRMDKSLVDCLLKTIEPEEVEKILTLDNLDKV